MKKIITAFLTLAALAMPALYAQINIYRASKRVDVVRWDAPTNTDPVLAYKVYLYAGIPSTLPGTANNWLVMTSVVPAISRFAIVADAPTPKCMVRISVIGTNGLEGPLSTPVRLP